MKSKFLPFVVAIIAAVPSFAQNALPSPSAYLGYEIGSRFTPHHRIVDYFREIDRLSGRVTIEQYGTSYEERPLIYAVVTSEANQQNIASIRERLNQLSAVDRTDPATAASIARSTPVAVWLAFGVHGNESSSAEASMLTLHELVTRETGLLDGAVVIIDPVQNPDGRERYIQFFHRSVGSRANERPEAFEKFEPWPGGRFNHYMIDMNRDWAWTTQKESRARVAAYRQWHPQVFVDLHEMSSESSYYFPPNASPINANIAPETQTWLERFGRANAKLFTDRNWPFFVGERFDLHYPGYGDSWPSLRGAIGMTYEVAGGGRAGTVTERRDETRLTLRDRAERHAASSMMTVRTAVENREALVHHTYRALRSRYEQARTTYLIPPGSSQLDDAARMLQRQGISVFSLRQPARLRVEPYDRSSSETREFPAGTVVVPTKQALAGLVQTMMERNPALQEEFVEAQRKKLEADESDDFYDITSWSVPLSHNLETFVTSSAVNASMVPWSESPAGLPSKGRSGYLIRANDPHLYRTLGELLRQEIRFSVATVPLEVAGERLANGTVVILHSNNENLDERIAGVARTIPVRLMPVNEGWSSGPALGSDDIVFVERPEIAIVGGEGTNAPSFGMLWQTLDVEIDLPHTVVPLSGLRNLDLDRYSVLILPDGTGYSERLGKSGTEKLQAWVRAGGTVVAVKNAAAYLRGKEVEISKVKEWEAPKKEGEAPAEERYNDYRIPGAAFRTELNRRGYLSYGIDRSPPVLIEGSRALLPLARRADNVLTIAKEDPVVSGFTWPESLDRVKGAAYLTMETYGGGRVITFADDPVYRLFWKGTRPLFLNAVIYSPTFSR